MAGSVAAAYQPEIWGDCPYFIQGDCFRENLVSMLEKTSSTPVAEGYQRLLEALDEFRVLNNSAALLIIDPQRSFTQGVWMQSMGTEAAAEITPIAAAFTNCSKLLKEGIYEGLLANFNSDGSWHPKSPCTKTIY